MLTKLEKLHLATLKRRFFWLHSPDEALQSAVRNEAVGQMTQAQELLTFAALWEREGGEGE